MEITWESTSSALDILFKSTDVGIASSKCGLTAAQYISCYKSLRGYIVQICKGVVAAAPQSSDLELIEYYVTSYERYKWALHYTARLFAYGERHYIPRCRDNGHGWLDFDPNDESLKDSEGVLDMNKVRAMMTKTLEEMWGLPKVHSSKDMEQAVLRAEVASDVDRVVGVKAMGLRQWRIEINEPWLQSGGRERLRDDLGSNSLGKISVQYVLQRLDIGEMPGQYSSLDDTPFGESSKLPSESEEAARTKEVLRIADSLVEDGFPKIIDNFTKYGTYLGRDMLQLFVGVLYGRQLPPNTSAYRGIDTTFGMLAILEKTSHWFQQTKFLIKYLEDGGGTKPVQEFIQSIREIDEWDVPEKDEFSRVWQILGHSPSLGGNMIGGEESFQGQIRKIFPQQPMQALKSFTISITDIESVGLTIKPTSLWVDHLQQCDNVVKILVANTNVWELREYCNNRAAKALGIASLGEEILATLNALYGKDQLYQRAAALEILDFDNALSKAFGPTMISLAKAPPMVLAYRARKLEELIKYRRSWLPSLIRDIKKQFEIQPFIFYGAILAVFFGLCTLIQTITSIWSVVLAIQQRNSSSS